MPSPRPGLQWCVAPFGLDLVLPDPAAPGRFGLTRPYFLALGTLEPRKSIDLLLSIWRSAGQTGDDEFPTLVLCGARGWYPPDFFASLEADPRYGTGIVEISGASDAEVAGLLAGSEGLLFPTRAEGFGFPAFEAFARGVPVICSDLAVFHETLGSLPVYLPPDESYAWLSIIKQGCAKPDPAQCAEVTSRFTWDRHFSRVFTGT
jgi:glycosyltransferase involved in cell wall biosynthesis